MNIRKLKKQLKKVLNKENVYMESFFTFHNQTSVPKTFLNYLKKYNKEHLIYTNKDFEECLKLSNDKILMLSKEHNNYFIFVFYE